MAFQLNSNGARGFQPFRAANGTPMRVVEYKIAGDYGTNIYRGAPVILGTDGYLAVAADEDSVILGVFDGCEYVDTQGNVIFSSYWPAPGAVKTGTVPTARVFEAQGGLFLVTSDEDLVDSDVGEYFTLTAFAGGSDVTGQSSIQLDGSSNATTVVDRVVILRQKADFDGVNNQAIVQFIRVANPETYVFPATA